MEFYHKFFPYAVAISWTAIALLLKLWLAPFLSRTIGAFFYIAIIVSTWYGGFRSGFVAVVLSTLAINYFFTPPQYQLGIERPEDVFQLAIFFLVAFTLNLLTSNFRDSKQKIELQQSELFEQVQTELAERKLVIAALQEREAILRLFAQYVPAGIAMFDRDMHYLIASQRWVDEYNLESVESLINRSHYEIFPEIPERWRQIHQRCLAGAIEKCEEDLFVRADGTQQWIWWEIHPWHTATDEIGGIIIFSVDITNRKHIEIALRESQIQLQRQLAEIETIYQSAPIGLSIFDTELRFVRINQRLAEINGLPVEAHIGRTVSEVVPNLANAAEQLLRSILATGEPVLNVEIIGETPAQPGVQRTWMESWLPLKDSDRIIGISVVCEETTERKQAQMALQQLNAELEQRVAQRTAELSEVNTRLLKTLTALEKSEERRRLALDLTHIGFWDMHLPSKNIIWNDNHFTLLGLAPYSIEPSYELWRSHVYPDDIVWVEQRFLASMENRTDYTAEYRVVHPDGSVHWLMGRAKAIYDESGRPVRSLGVLLDISDRKRTEEELRQSEAKFRSLSECSPLGIFMTDIQGRCTYTNPRYQAICGCTFDEALGEGWVQFLHPEDRQEVTARWSKAVSQRQEFRSEIRYVHKDRTIRFGRVQSAPIFSVSGELIGYVGTVEDVTDKRAVETMKNEFISIVSHELRTPLASIYGSLGLLAAGVLKKQPESAQQMLDIAAQNTERLVRLVNDILDLERLEAQKVKLNKQCCDVATLLQQSVETVQALATENNITLCVEPTAIQLWVDGDRIIQTLVNLVSNAIKFSPPETTVTLSVQDQADRVLFKVQDRGRGIPADKLETIFGRFQQVDASDSRQKGGTGLGLAICKSIVQQHGGKIWVESVVGEGSSFYFSLPKSLD